jgi:drug/metabolite transporter (DMT)-like permease
LRGADDDVDGETCTVLTATFMALAAACLHAGWNLAVKRNTDSGLALWGQFFIAMFIAGGALIGWWLFFDGPSFAWQYTLLSGITHLPYSMLLVRAYNTGDFSVSYPIARGGGAVGAAVLGMVLLDDVLSPLTLAGIVRAAVGFFLLSRGSLRQMRFALATAVIIGIYTAIDATGVRESADPAAYALSIFVTTGMSVSAWTFITRRKEALVALRMQWKQFGFAAIGTLGSYCLVLLAMRQAPVGYVAVLRESSVLIAAFAGWKLLGEVDHRRRIGGAAVVLVGLIALVAGG